VADDFGGIAFLLNSDALPMRLRVAPELDMSTNLVRTRLGGEFAVLTEKMMSSRGRKNPYFLLVSLILSVQVA
jgi:hypothetical protein